jgi:hypothetical protein
MQFLCGGSPSASVIVQIVRIGKIVNLLIPSFSIGPCSGSVITSVTTLPQRFRPFCTVRGASSTLLSAPAVCSVTCDCTPCANQLGEYEVAPTGIITFGLSGGALGPQPFVNPVAGVDVNTITYNTLGCGCSQ